MEGDLAVRPRAACAECGRRVAPPLGPSFVYGVGAIGFQHCPACGARWRCLWQPTKRRPSVRALVLIGVVLLTLAAGAVAYASTRASDEPELTSVTRGAEPSTPAPPASSAAGRYRAIVAPGNSAKSELRDFLGSVPPATPRAELDRHVAAYAAVARRTDSALRGARWPKDTAGAVKQLVAADRAYTAELVHGVGRLNETRFGKQFDGVAAALHTAANRVRAALGLPALGDALDRRFPPL